MRLKKIEERFKEKEQAAYKAKLEKRQKNNITKKPDPKPPGGKTPEDKSQYNFTDPESRIMKAGNGSILNRHVTLSPQWMSKAVTLSSVGV